MKQHKFIVKRPYIKWRLALILGIVFSQTFAGYEIKTHTINNGGSTMTSGSYKMTSSIAQVDASMTMSGVNFSINGGFWHAVGSSTRPELIFNNGFE